MRRCGLCCTCLKRFTEDLSLLIGPHKIRFSTFISVPFHYTTENVTPTYEQLIMKKRREENNPEKEEQQNRIKNIKSEEEHTL